MKKIYIDFDSTLFDTNAFYSDFLKLCFKHGIDNKFVKEFRKKLFKKDSDFNLDILGKELSRLYELDQTFLDELEDLYSEKYLYKDAILFLKSIYLKYELVLLTFGNKEYQDKKIRHSNIKKYFSDIIITDKSKGSLNINYQESVFIDNNPSELLGFYKKGAKYLIRIRKNNDNYAKYDTNLDEVLEFSNFFDIINCNIIDGWLKNE